MHVALPTRSAPPLRCRAAEGKDTGMSREPPALPSTLPGLLERRVALTPDATAYFTRDAGGRWRPTSWRAFAADVGAVTRGLSEHGLRRGDRIAILAPTSLPWDCCQLAALSLGACVVGIDPHYPAERR